MKSINKYAYPVDVTKEVRIVYDESPAHVVRLDSFYLDLTEVTNAHFAQFAAASGYKT